jgi:hypothetical protein
MTTGLTAAPASRMKRERKGRERSGRFPCLELPAGFIRFSDAISRLANGMFGGLQRPAPVVAMKRIHKTASIGFAEWREQAGQRLTNSTMKGTPTVYVIAKPRVPTRDSAREAVITPIPIKVLSRLITSRGSLPDHPMRPSLKTTDGDTQLFALLTVGILVVREREFMSWYRSERSKGKWPSQRSRLKRGGGRPTKQTEAIRNVILRLVHSGAWNGKASIAKLHRLLVNSGWTDVPSPDTLARLVDRLRHETGEPGFLRRMRSPASALTRTG